MPEAQVTKTKTQSRGNLMLSTMRGIVESVVTKLVATILVGVILGVILGRASVTDSESKGLYAEIENVAPGDGGRGLGESIRVSGTATASLPAGFEMRYAVRGTNAWYPNPRPLTIVDGRWVLDTFLGPVDDTYVLTILFGKTSDFDLWMASKQVLRQ